MPGGYTGKILRVNLTTKEISRIDTAKYEEWGGGHGIGSAVFFDLVGDQLPFPAFDPRNLIIMMASPFSGTFMPASGRCEVQGLGPGLYPVEWFGHSNYGGRFTSQLKFAGWDGIVVEGAGLLPANSLSCKTTPFSVKEPSAPVSSSIAILRKPNSKDLAPKKNALQILAAPILWVGRRLTLKTVHGWHIQSQIPQKSSLNPKGFSLLRFQHWISLRSLAFRSNQ